MKRLTLAVLAAASLAAAAGAAQAQERWGYGHGPGYGHGGRGQPIEARLDRIDQRIDRGLYRGDLTRREAVFLRRDLDRVAHLHHRYARDGLSRWEWDDLNRRLSALAERVRFERRDPEGRRHGDWDRRHGDWDDDDHRRRY